LSAVWQATFHFSAMIGTCPGGRSRIEYYDIDVAIMIDDEVVGTILYESPINVPIPNVGEAVVNPQTDGLVVKVRRRIFE